MFSYKWYLKDGFPASGIEKHGNKVFSCFACGGGSSMGYKLAGYDVIGHCDIDKRMIDVYQNNLHPKYSFISDIRKICEIDLPEELYHLDILDGSPPCSTFSMAGDRDKAWGKEKVFREGQAKQTLDDLFFEFLKFADRIKPRIIVAENVKGLVLGKAKKYAYKIFETLDGMGYKTQLFLLNAATMGVPQKRERVFFIAQRKEEYKALKMQFSEQPIYLRDVIDYGDKKSSPYWNEKPIKCDHVTDADTNYILRRKKVNFGTRFLRENNICPTIIAGKERQVLVGLRRPLNSKELCLCGSYPLDYNFGKELPAYLIGMSVPPVMMAQVSYQIYKQLLEKSL